MGNCKLAHYPPLIASLPEGTTLKRIIYSCDEIRDKIEDLKAEFRESNGTDVFLMAGMRDEAYEDFCESLDNFLKKCTCNDIPLRCDKCTEENHEGYFCRCEMRNIALSKQLREKGISTWQKDNKGEG